MIEFTQPKWPKIKGILEALALPPVLRRRLLTRTARLVIAQAKQNVKSQTTINGSPMVPRKRLPSKWRKVYHRDGTTTFKKANKRMLFDIVKGKYLGIKRPQTPSEALIHFFCEAGYVANKHQLGGQATGAMHDAVTFPRSIDDAKLNLTAKRQTLASGSVGCSARQSAMLLRLGVFNNQSWCMSNVSGFAASKIIEDKIGSAKMSKVKDTTPARPFLGVNDAQIQSYREYVMQTLHDKFRAKNYKG